MRRGALLAAAALLLVGGCDGDEGGQDGDSTTTEAPTTTEAETTTTTAAPDPFSVPEDPADIDEAYVEAVLAELERINGDALRLAVSEGLSPRITELITSIFASELAAIEIDLLVDSSIESFAGIRRPPGDVVVGVDQLNVVRLDCISLDAVLDYSAVSEGGVVEGRTRIELRPQRDGSPTNPTGWVYVVRDALPTQTGLPEECAAS